MTFNEAKRYARDVDINDSLYDQKKWEEAVNAYVKAGRCINCGGRLAPWEGGNQYVYSGRECYQCEEFYKCGEQPEYDTTPDCHSDADPGL